MAEYKTEKQVNYGWGLSLEMTGKAPAIAKRIFETLSDAQAYADDVNDSAIAGLQLSVINDTDSSKNGIYFVKSIGDGTNPAVLELVGKGESADNPPIDLSEYATKNFVEETVENTFDTYLNTQGFTAKTVYLTETDWTILREKVEAGIESWENNVIYMVYSDD